ncbi:TIGR03752 family integrating conjugative element protein [Vibrio pectenicida]|uniref:TIGR03752 family integrating conjugative element protein n=1 Tax=Vibrio pectenicida TaxID=62763 RepID=A0A3R9L2T0_9VIBR|nr:TIGR03752 family integrating conjugative element protein [Vibrio pectenicida]RSD31708.1 TIGR03752 family integrating conjugative element protein [Vibrio pectenicida]
MVTRNKLALGLACLLVAIVLISILDGKRETQPAALSESNDSSQPVIVDAQALGGAFKDGAVDTLRTLAATMTITKQENEDLKGELESANKILGQQKEKTRTLEDNLSTLTQRLTQLDDRIRKDYQSLKNKQRPILSQSTTTDCDDPTYQALGLGDTDCQWNAASSSNNNTHQSVEETWVWVNPLNAQLDDNGNMIRTETTQPSVASTLGTTSSLANDSNTSFAMPLYSLHPGAVLADANAMTALMGRVPIDGQVTDPYPFSMIIGPENLLANGMTLPEVKGAIVTGTVTGDWSLSCVRGAVETFSLILENGEIINYPEKMEGVIQGDFDGSEIKTQDLGYLADPTGNPCISGRRISNAPEYLTSKGLLDAATAAANAVAISQQTISVDGSTSTSALTGSATKNAVAQASAASAQTVSDFIQSRMGMSFDIIYVEPGVQAAIHLRQPITLHRSETPRYVRSPQLTTRGHYALP